MAWESETVEGTLTEIKKLGKYSGMQLTALVIDTDYGKSTRYYFGSLGRNVESRLKGKEVCFTAEQKGFFFKSVSQKLTGPNYEAKIEGLPSSDASRILSEYLSSKPRVF